MYCSHCGQPLTEGARFCPACGASVGAATSGPAEPTAVLAPGEPTAAPAPGVAAEPVSAHGPGSTGAPSSPWAPTVAASAGVSDVPTPVPPAAATWAPATALPPGVAGAEAAARYAGFWRRFWGLVVDRCVLGIVLFPVGLVFGINLLWPVAEDGEMTAERFLAILFGSLSIWLIRTFAEWVYFSSFQCSPRQATPGQMLLGIRVTGQDGRRIGFGRASGRYFASWLSAAILLIGFIMGAFTARKQTLHDLIAGTLVLRDAPRSA